MKKGFTLLELIVVIVIIGILATLGFAQYTRMIERSRGAEAREVLGTIRTQAAALWVGNNSGTPPTMPAGTIVNSAVGIGNNAGQIASACNAAAPSTSYYFSYNIAQNATNDGFVATAIRCTGANGKQPGNATADTLILTSSFANGTDTWSGTGGY